MNDDSMQWASFMKVHKRGLFNSIHFAWQSFLISWHFQYTTCTKRWHQCQEWICFLQAVKSQPRGRGYKSSQIANCPHHFLDVRPLSFRSTSTATRWSPSQTGSPVAPLPTLIRLGLSYTCRGRLTTGPKAPRRSQSSSSSWSRVFTRSDFGWLHGIQTPMEEQWTGSSMWLRLCSKETTLGFATVFWLDNE